MGNGGKQRVAERGESTHPARSASRFLSLRSLSLGDSQLTVSRLMKAELTKVAGPGGPRQSEPGETGAYR